jgi:hypothetical protein
MDYHMKPRNQGERFMKTRLWGAVSACLFTLVTTLSNAAVVQPLEGRLPATPGGTDYQAYYDPNLDITWAADANINGTASWDNQVAWAAGLTIGGFGGWRLPSVDVNGDGTVVDCFGGGVTGCADNEMGYLYWEESITASTPGPFSNVQSSEDYWSGTEFAPIPTDAWGFAFSDGLQFGGSSSIELFAWAVRTGDVPLPAAVWLFGSGLIGLLGLARRKR